MNILEYLNQKQIEYKVVGKEAKLNCPKCNRNEFSINIGTGQYQCWRKNKCGIEGGFKEFRELYGDVSNYYSEEKEYSDPKPINRPANEKARKFLASRKLNDEWLDKFRIFHIDNDIVFPYHKNKKIVNRKYRDMSKKHFRAEKNAMPCLWLQDYVNIENPLIICEGELDALSLWQYGLPTVSIPFGASNMQWVENDWEFLENFNEIYLVMDSDEAGKNATKKIIERLGLWRCKEVMLPRKDANECLMNGVATTEINQCFTNAKEYNLKELKGVADFKEEIRQMRENPNELKGVVTSDFRLTEILQGWRDGELTIWTGRNGSGKSTFILQEILHLANNGKKIMLGSFEMKPKRFLYWLVKQSLRVENPTHREVDLELERLNENIKIVDIDSNIEKQKLYDIMLYGFQKYGLSIFVIDSLMKIELTTKDYELLGEQKKFINELVNFTKQHKSHIHLVAHPRKGDGKQVNKIDVAGTSAITDLAHNVMIVNRVEDAEKESRKSNGKEPFDMVLTVGKNREFGTEGNVGYYFNPETKSFSEIKTVDNFEVNNGF